MSFISTALSGVTDFLGDVADGLGSFVRSPIGTQAVALGGQLLARELAPSAPSRPPGGSLAMPGGAPTTLTAGIGLPSFGGVNPMPMFPTSLAQPAALPGVVDRMQGQAGAIVPIPTRGGLRLPRIVHTVNPNDPNKIETYVRAPRPRYKVSISGPRRRCRGGR